MWWIDWSVISSWLCFHILLLKLTCKFLFRQELCVLWQQPVCSDNWHTLLPRTRLGQMLRLRLWKPSYLRHIKREQKQLHGDRLSENSTEYCGKFRGFPWLHMQTIVRRHYKYKTRVGRAFSTTLSRGWEEHPGNAWICFSRSTGW